MTEIMEWAIRYQGHGFSIIPVGKDKKPTIPWKKYQTERATKEQVEEWFKGDNPPGIGIVTGKISGITVVDVEKGGKWMDLPTTMTAKSGGDGVHLYYKYAEGVGNSARIRELTDIRGDGGYIIAPPSGHPSGGKYEWLKKDPMQQFPFGKFNTQPANTDWKEIIDGIGEGSRNDSAAKVVGKLIQTFPPSEWKTNVWEMLVMWNQKNNPPLDEGELRNTFNSITGKAARTGNHKKEDTTTGEEMDVPVKLISDIAKDLSDDISISYPTGYEVFDKAFMGGVKEGDLVIISGFTGNGKTLLAQSMTHNMVNAGQPCMWFSYEVTMGELWRKFKDMGVEENFKAYAPEKIATHKIDFVAQKIIEARDTFQTKIVFVDHLGFLVNDPSNYDQNLSNNYATQLTTICRRLKSIALSEGVVIVLLAHLKKPAHSSSEPDLHDLKDSSGIAQESDAVVLINRKKDTDSEPTGYGPMDNGGNIYTDDSLVKIVKNRRTGQTKMFNVTMDKGVLIDNAEMERRKSAKINDNETTN